MSFSRALIGLSLLFFQSAVLADETETVFVSSQRFPIKLSEAIAPVTLIDRESIELSGSVNLPTLLAQTAGIAFTSTGGKGQPASLFVRGTESDHYLVLVDGVRIASASSGATALNLIPLDAIERIEIVRGPQSSLYGSEALGGLIHIFTRDSASNDLNLRLEKGSENSKLAEVFAATQLGESELSLGFSHQSTDGIDATTNIEADRDAHRQNTVQAKWARPLSDRLRFETSFFHSSGRQDFDQSFETDPGNRFTQQVLNFGLQWQPAQTTHVALKLAESRDELDVDTSFPDFFDTRTRQFSLTGYHRIIDSTLSAGVDWRDEQLRSRTAYQESARSNYGVFVNLKGSRADWHYSFSGRIDDNEAFDTESTFNAVLARDTRAWRIGLSAGTAYKAPSFNDLYFPDFPPFFFSNPDLSPEESDNIELFLSRTHANTRWRLSAFRTDIKDLITFTDVRMQNIDRARIKGLEFDYSVSGQQWDLAFNAMRLDHEDRSTGVRLLRRPELTANLSATWRTDDWSAQAQLAYADKRDDLDFSSFPAERRRVADYVLLHLTFKRQLNKNLGISLRVHNALDEAYETTLGFNQPERQVFVGLDFAL